MKISWIYSLLMISTVFLSQAEMLMHDIEIQVGTDEKITVRVKSEEHLVREWTRSVVILIHKSSSLRIAAVITDAKNNQRALVTIPQDQSNSRRARDFFMEIYGMNSDGKVVTYTSKSLDPNMQQGNHDLRKNMTYDPKKLTRKHISKAEYEVRLPKKDENRFYKFLFLTEVLTEERHIFLWGNGGIKFTIPFPLKPTKEYVIDVFFGNSVAGDRFTLNDEYSALQFKAAMNKDHLELLLNQATEFCENNPAPHLPIHFLYRNKPKEYFKTILSKENQGIMTKYMKNDGGDQASPLNRSIQGLFFSAFYWKTRDGQFIVPPTSPFGDQRFHVAVQFFLNPINNLYFADFYCHYKNHHVTVVVTEDKSFSDNFCKENLILLESFNNPFLYYNRSNGCFFINTSVNVEVFYTENIDVGRLLSCGSRYALFTVCGSVGDSRTKSFIGQRKNVNCIKCNLNT